MARSAGTRFPPELTVDLHAELLHRRKEWGKVPDFLAACVSQAKTDKDRLDRVLVAARLLERLGGELTAPAQRELALNYFEKAREWYESYVQKRPGSEMLLAGFHARHGKVEEALQRIERYGEKSDPREVLGVVGAIVSRPKTTPVQLKRLEALVACCSTRPTGPRPCWAAWRKSNRPGTAAAMRKRSIARCSA